MGLVGETVPLVCIGSEVGELEVGGLEVGGLEVGRLEVEAEGELWVEVDRAIIFDCSAAVRDSCDPGGLLVPALEVWLGLASGAISIVPVTAMDVSEDGTLPG